MSTVPALTTSPPPFVGVARVTGGWFWALWPSQDEFYQRLRRQTLPDRFGVERTKSKARRAAEMAATTQPIFAWSSWVARSAYQAVRGDQQVGSQGSDSEVAKTACEADEAKFATIQTLFESCRQNPLVDASLMTWTLPTDRQLPSRLLGKSLRTILDGSLAELVNARSVGPTRLRGLLTVLERAVQTVRDSPHHRPASASDQLSSESDSRPTNAASSVRPEHRLPDSSLSPVPPPSAPADESVEGGPWQAVCERAHGYGAESDDPVYWELCWRAAGERIRAHQLHRYSLGRFARSLRTLPKRLWAQPLSAFLDGSFANLLRLPGCGLETPWEIVAIAMDLSGFLAGILAGSRFHVHPLPTAIGDVTHWINGVLANNEVPDLGTLQLHLIRPILEQLETDLGPKIRTMVERRLGADATIQSFAQIGAAFHLTADRIRQQTLRAPGVLLVRWPEGRHLMYEFVDRFRDLPHAREQVELIQRCVNVLYSPRPSPGFQSPHEDSL